MSVKEKLVSNDSWSGPDEEEKRAWQVYTVKGVAFVVLVMSIYSLLAWWHTAPDPLPMPCTWRAVVQCVLLLGMLIEMGVELFAFPAASKDTEVFTLLRMAGKPIFLTFWILTLQTVHAILGTMAELALLMRLPAPSLLAFNYSAALFVDTVGIMLTLLFLKFNYFEDAWRKDVMGLWEARGVPFGRLSLIGHLPSLPIAVLDMIARDRSFMQKCQGSNLAVNASVITGFSIAYVCWMHIWWARSDFKCWPYPFMHEFGTCCKRVAFAIVIILALLFLMVLLSLLA